MPSLLCSPISPYLAGQLLRWRAARSFRRIISQPRSSAVATRAVHLIDRSPTLSTRAPCLWRLAAGGGGLRASALLRLVIFWWLEHAHCSWRPGPGRGPAGGAPCRYRCPSRAFNHHHTTPHRAFRFRCAVLGCSLACLLPRSGEEGGKAKSRSATSLLWKIHLVWCTATCLYMDPPVPAALQQGERRRYF